MVVYNKLSTESSETRKSTQALKGAFGLFFIIFGVLLLTQGPVVFDNIVDDKLVLTENSGSAAAWADLAIPVYVEFYLFNWTNPEDFTKNGTKPILKELGPYTYREVRWKIVDQWNPDNGTVTFRQNRTWHFEPELTKGSLDDVVTTINTVAVAAEHACRDLDEFSKMLIDSAIHSMDSKPYVKATVREMLFDGYEDPLLSLVSMLPPDTFALKKIPSLRFGWLHTRNGSDDGDGVFNMHTGSGPGGLKDFGKIAQFNYDNKSTFKGHCGELVGSAGELFPPHAKKNQSVSIYSPEICRPVHLNYKGEKVVDGVPVSRYLVDETLFEGQDSNPDNWCYCNSDDKSQCPPAGVLDLSRCKDVPAYLSAPHFHLADPSYREAVTGMEPDPVKHQTFVDIIPKLGLPMGGTAAFQINILVQEQEGFSLFEGAPKIYFPTMWFRQTITVDADSLGYNLKVLVYLPLAIKIVSYICIAIGFILLILIILRTLYRKSPRKTNISYIAVQNV